MNRSRRLVLMGGVLAAVVAFAADGVHAQDEAALRALVDKQAEAWNRGDAAAWCAAFAPDADFVNIVGMNFQGRPEIEKRHAGIFATVFKGSHTKVTVRKLTFPRPDVALLETEHEVTGFAKLPPGIQPTEPGVLRTRMKYVLTREGSGWLIIAGQNTAISPAAMAPPPPKP